MGTKSVAGDQGPPYDEVLQLEEPFLPERVPVSLELPVHTREVQAADGQLVGKGLTFGATQPCVKILNADPLRGPTTLVATGAVWLGYERADCDARITQWPANVPLHIRHGRAVYATPVTADCIVTAAVDFWVK